MRMRLTPSLTSVAILVAACTSPKEDGSGSPSSAAVSTTPPPPGLSSDSLSAPAPAPAPMSESGRGMTTPTVTAPVPTPPVTPPDALPPPKGGAPSVPTPQPQPQPPAGGAPQQAKPLVPAPDGGAEAMPTPPLATDSGAPDASAPEEAAPGGFRKQWTCPDPATLPAPMEGERLTVCEDFDFEYGFTEGPTWIASENAFFFSNFAQGNGRTGNIIKYNFMGDCELWLEDAGTNGLAVHANGNLIGASHLNRAVMEYDLVTKEQKVLADAFMDDHLDAPNDLVAHSNGTIYFTNPTHENSGRPGGFGKAVFRIDPMGEISLIEKTGGQPNGIALSPDERQLHVVKASGWELDADGVPTNKSGGGHGGDGISVDCAGNVRAIAINSAFGGPDGTWLFVVTKGQPPHMVKYNLPGLP